MENSSSSNSVEDARLLLKLIQAPPKDLDIQSEQRTKGEIKRKLEPEWLERFLKRTFFDPCSEHEIRKNELNRYCIECDVSLCQFCLSPASHEGHRLLKLYRHVYKEVVALDDIERHIDCSRIQPYRCNKQMVVSLTPLPHCGGNTSDEITCQVCKRKLIEYHIYSYCSISCKVEAFTKKEDDNSPPFLSLNVLVRKAKHGSERKKSTVDQQVQKAKHGSTPKKPTADHLVQKTKHRSSEQKKTNVDRSAKMEHEAELKNMNIDPLLKETSSDQLMQMENEESELEKADPDSPVNQRKRRRKGIPYRAPFF